MEKVTRIVILSLCAALTLGSCTKKHHQPAEPLKAPLEFTAVSQNSALKSGATKATTPLSAFHGDFGAWGIARQEGNATPYILWESNAMSQVVKSTDNTYVPVADAYWLTGFAYNFIAVAPYTEGASDLDVDHSVDAQTGEDAITFTFDQGAKYTAGDYDFDLMGAAAATDAITTKPTTQPLTFWHLFSQVNIGVSFSTGLNGEAIDGRLKSIKLDDICTNATCSMYHHESTNMVHADWTCADDAATMDCEYIVSEEVTFTVKADQADATVTLKAGDQTVTKVGGEAKIDVLRGTKVKYTVEETVADGEEATKVVGETLVHRSLTQNVSLASGETRTELHPDWSINVIPQDATKMKLYLDFEIYDDGTSDVYNDFEIGLTFPSDANPQVFNHKYNWNISIGTGAAIKFEVVDVTDWTTVDGGDILM